MKIFIPMAGKGTRLRPFTLTCPKPLLQINDKPIVEHLIDQITSKLTTKIEEIIYILGDEAYFNSDVVTSLTLIAKKYNAKTKVIVQICFNFHGSCGHCGNMVFRNNWFIWL